MKLAIIAVLIATTSPSCTVPISSSAVIRCDHMYTFPDQDGTFYIQRACGGSKAPWGYELSPNVQATVLGFVDERGMDWTVGGVPKPRQAPHLGVPASYTFHGTFTVQAGDDLTYSDQLSYRHGIGPGGTVTVTIHGAMTFTDEPSG